MRKIGILGGSFDPVHEGHIYIALQAKKAWGLNEVWFMPSLNTPVKQPVASYQQRCAMIKMMIKPYRKLRLCTLEGQLPEPSYTITTARELNKHCPTDQFYWIIGSDALQKLDHWRDIDELKKLVQFVCVCRTEVQCELDYVKTISIPVHPASSSDIRNGRLNYIPFKLRRYIMDNGIYTELLAKSMVKEKRWNHVVSMTNLALEIAEANHVDRQKTFMAGMFHDCTKKWSNEESEISLKVQRDELNLSYAPPCWHQSTAAYYLKHYCNLNDKTILKAIRHHCIGDDDSDISMIIYLADKLDPSRGYDSSKEIELAKQDLKKAFLLVHQQQNEYLKKTGVL